MEPIEKINAPKTKTIRRFSFFFKDGTAQDFNLDPVVDRANRSAEGWSFEYASGKIEGVNRDALAWWREQTLEVPVVDASRRQQKTAQLAEAAPAL